jgi:tetratricopeptide (TPR) repeat protein
MKNIFLTFLILIVSNFAFGQRNAREYFLVGNDFFKQGDYSFAIRAYGRAIELDSTVADYYFARGVAKTYFSNLDALPDYDKAIKLDTLNTYFFEGRGHYHADKNDWEKAFNDYY